MTYLSIIIAANMIKIKDALSEAYNILKQGNIDSYIIDSQILLSHVLNVDKLYILVNKDSEISNKEFEEFKYLVNLRKNRVPIKYIIKKCNFMDLELYIEEGVLIPRGDTEILVENAIKIIREENLECVCDLCSGSGAIGISINYYTKVKVDLVDISPLSESVIKINMGKYSDENVKFIKCDVLKEPLEIVKIYDMVVSNPPYIKSSIINELMEDVKNYEPHLALDGGEDGLVFYRKIINDSKKIIRKGGYLIFEIGYDQGESVSSLMKTHFKDIKIIKDLNNFDRVVIGKLK